MWAQAKLGQSSFSASVQGKQISTLFGRSRKIFRFSRMDSCKNDLSRIGSIRSILRTPDMLRRTIPDGGRAGISRPNPDQTSSRISCLRTSFLLVRLMA
ncbi:hypothetical protein FGO68_gene15032 [Halteria grandinella]|uniref:Uncharacterized protein n=1 Tax=Halteria grandinella TaxID=5974 RepID=A0A8J8NAX0_HALGN|nr:hypothetical protein FGO68_gene15032 [Halteria grandinella]